MKLSVIAMKEQGAVAECERPQSEAVMLGPPERAVLFLIVCGPGSRLEMLGEEDRAMRMRPERVCRSGMAAV